MPQEEWPTHCIHNRPIGEALHCNECRAIGMTPIAVRQILDELDELKKPRHQYLVASFIKTMDEIGAYGARKYASTDFLERAKDGDFQRSGRTQPLELANHATNHFHQYLGENLHDHFGTLKHQLAAVAFNAMMEYHFARLEETECSKDTAKAQE